MASYNEDTISFAKQEEEKVKFFLKESMKSLKINVA